MPFKDEIKLGVALSKAAHPCQRLLCGEAKDSTGGATGGEAGWKFG
jgi:hypothetical protein